MKHLNHHNKSPDMLKILSPYLDAMLMLSKTTSPQKVFPSDIITMYNTECNSCCGSPKLCIHYPTGWPVKHGRVFLVPCKKWLVQCTLLHTCTLDKSLLKGTRKHGHVKLVTLYITYIHYTLYNIYISDNPTHQP